MKSSSPMLAARSDCPWLATLAAAAVTALGSLMFRGAAVSNTTTDVVPCLLSALLMGLAVHEAGRLSGRPLMVVTGLAALLTIIAGRVLAWDLFGIVGRWTGDAATDLSWSTRLQQGWESTPQPQRWVNLAGWLLTPAIAMITANLLRRTNASHAGDDALPDCVRSLESDTLIADRQTLCIQSRRLWIVSTAWVLAVAAVHWGLSTRERNGFLAATYPTVRSNQENTLFGFAHLRDGRVQMREEIPAIEQVTWFMGAVRSDSNFRFLRAGHAFLASQMAPLFGPEGGLLALNGLAWLLSLTCTWRIATQLFDSPIAGCVALVLAAPGVGYAMHWNSATPHLLSFTLYAVGLVLLLESRISSESRPWRVHLAFGLVLGLISLVYNVALMLLLVYFAVGFRKQRITYLISAGIVALAFQPTWRLVLPAIGINVLDVEGGYLSRALAAWRTSLIAGPFTFLGDALRLGIESLTAMETPWVLLLGLGGLLTQVPRSRRWFVAWGVLAPLLACTLFAPIASARGYIVYGSSLLWFAAAGGWLARGLTSSRHWRILALATTVAAAGGQLLWSVAIARGSQGPIIGYFLGWDDAAPLLAQAAPRIISLTGQDTVPAAWNGAGLGDAVHAVHSPPPVEAGRRSRVLAYLSRNLFVTGVALIISVSLTDRRQRRRAVLGWLLLVVVTTEGALWARCPATTYRDISQGVQLAPGETVTLSVQVPVSVRSQLISHIAPSAELRLFVPAHSEVEVTCRIAGVDVALEPWQRSEAVCLTETPPSATADVEVWEVSLTNRTDRPTMLSGWQRTDTPGKSLSQVSADCLPAIEFRVRDRKSGCLVALAF